MAFFLKLYLFRFLFKYYIYGLYTVSPYFYTSILYIFLLDNIIRLYMYIPKLIWCIGKERRLLTARYRVQFLNKKRNATTSKSNNNIRKNSQGLEMPGLEMNLVKAGQHISQNIVIIAFIIIVLYFCVFKKLICNMFTRWSG